MLEAKRLTGMPPFIRLFKEARMRMSVAAAALLLLMASKAIGQEWVTGTINGTVTDSAGAPLAGAEVILNNCKDAELDTSGPETRIAKSDKAGRYEIKLRFRGTHPLLVYVMWADHEGFVRASPPDLEISLAAGQVARQDFTLEKGEILAGVLRLPPDPSEQWPRQAERKYGETFCVTGPNLGRRPVNAQLYETDPDGRFAIHLPPGQYTVSTIGGYFSHEWPQLQTGKTNLVLELPPFEWTKEELAEAFDKFWQTLDRQYSYFFLKPDVDWLKLKDDYRPRAMGAKNAAELAAVLQKMLASLHDSHVWIKTPDGFLPTYSSSYSYNGNRRVVLAQLRDRVECGPFAVVGRTEPDGFGYFLMLPQGEATPEDVAKAGAAMRALSDAPGFIVDLRTANGGSEPLAEEIARLFCSRETIYAKSKTRGGPAHTDFTAEGIRILPATKQAYTGPVVCLIGPGAVSSGEGFVQMMRCLPHVTTIGLPTRGASGNPQVVPVSQTGVAVYFSSWVDLMPDGQSFEGVGIAPELRVEAEPAAYATADPTLQKGLEVLRSKVADAAK
jgi:Peptidase family S41/Tricorn protease C1 domain/Carboxypeptidase regulatory-like domain